MDICLKMWSTYLSWPEQQAAEVPRGTTVHDWSLNLFTQEEAAAELSILRAIASIDLHNLVYRADYRIVPAVTA
jgi:hypothetical protein